MYLYLIGATSVLFSPTVQADELRHGISSSTAATLCYDPHGAPLTPTACAGASGDMEVVFLQDAFDTLGIECLDGSVPAMHIAPATDPQHADDWVIAVQGGGSCSSLGECEPLYPSERDEMSTFTIDSPIEGTGILSDSSINNFAGWNRVKIHKCSFDRFSGTASLSGTSPSLGTPLDLHFHGASILDAAVDALIDGTASAAFAQGELKNMDEADTVLLVGSSGGMGGLIMQADQLRADIIAGKATPTAPDPDVRYVLDANFTVLPSTVFSPLNNPYSLACSGDIDFDGAGTSLTTINDCSDVYEVSAGADPERWVADLYDTWGVPQDLSCEAFHGGPSPLCMNHMHVLFNHLQGSTMIRQDLSDPNDLHRNVGTEHSTEWDDRCNSPLLCGSVLDDAEYESHQRTQAAALLGMDVHSEEAGSSSPSGGLPPRGPWFYGPDDATHVGVEKNLVFAMDTVDDGGGPTSFNDYLLDWLGATAIAADVLITP